MKNKCIKLEYQDAEPIAMEYFLENSGLDTDVENHKILLSEGLHVLENCKPGIDIAAVIMPLEPDAFHNSTIYMEKGKYTCTAFHQISPRQVVKIYAYLLSVGECRSITNNQAEQYYADLWANGFLEAGRQILREKIYQYIEDIGIEEYYISHSFGPGCYGMPLYKLSDMLEEIDGSIIGIKVVRKIELPNNRFSGGFFFVTSEEGELPSEECRNCIGHEGGCMFCGGKNLIPTRETCLELLESHGTPPHVIRHCMAVCDTAVRIGKALVEKGVILDLPLLEAASLLHDIARVEENHGVKGALIAERHGYHQVAKLIKCHMFYAMDPNKEKITELDLLCLADRMVREDEYVGLDDRMQYVMDKLVAAGVNTERFLHRIEENRLMKERIEKIIGKSIDDLMA
jgi:uncharacterized protein